MKQHSKTNKYQIIEGILAGLLFLIVPGFGIAAYSILTAQRSVSFAGSISPEIVKLWMAGILSLLAFLLVLGLLLVFRHKRKKRGFPAPLAKCNAFVRKHWLICTVGILLLLVLLLFVLALCLQNHFVFFPTRCEPSEQYLSEAEGFSQVSLENGKYVGWLYRQPEAEKVLVIFGGNAQNAAIFLHSLRIDGQLEKTAGYNLLMVDYPGYGLSEGKPSEKTILPMTDAIAAFVREQELGKVTYFGYSIGTGVATYAAAHAECEQLILLAPYENLTVMYNSFVNVFHGPLRGLVRNKFPSDEYAKDITVKTRIIASHSDELIPFASSEALSKCFADAEFFPVDNLGHNELIFDDGVWDLVAGFLHAEE